MAPSSSSSLPASSDPRTTLEEQLRLLSFATLEATFFRLVATHRPLGPHRPWALISISRELDRTIRALTARLAYNEERQKARKASRTPSRRDRNVKREDDDDEEEADDSEEGEVDHEGTEDAEDVELWSMLSIGPLAIPSEAIMAKLEEYYDIQGLDDLESAAVVPTELCSPRPLKRKGYASSLRHRPTGTKVAAEEDIDVDGQVEEEETPEAVDFTLVPGEDYLPLVAPRAVEDEELAKAGAGTASTSDIKKRRRRQHGHGDEDGSSDLSSDEAEGSGDARRKKAALESAEDTPEKGDEETDGHNRDEEDDEQEDGASAVTAEEDGDSNDEEASDSNSEEEEEEETRSRSTGSRRRTTADSSNAQTPLRSRGGGRVAATTPSSAKGSRATPAKKATKGSATPATRSSGRKR